MKPLGPEVNLSPTVGIGTTTLDRARYVRAYNPTYSIVSLFIRKNGEYKYNESGDEDIDVVPMSNIPGLTAKYYEKEPNDTVGAFENTQIRVTPIASSTILEYKNHRKLPADYTTGLIGHWDASDSSSYAGSQNNPVSTWNDISSNSNNLTVTNGVPIDSIGGALIFFGGNAVDTSASGISGPPITFGAWLWVYSEDIMPAEDGAPIILGSDDSNNIGLYIKKSGSDAILSYKWGNSNTTVDNFNSGLIIPREDPVFLAATVTSSEAKLYIFKLDGTVQTATHTVSAGVHSNKSMTQIVLGARNVAAAPRVFGIYNIVRIYNAALSQSQLQNVFEASNHF